VAITEHAFESVKERRLFSLALATPAALRPITLLSSRHFVCLIAWDSTTASVETVSTLVESLLRNGASYFVCWGPGCERVHDIIDETVSHPDSDFGVPAESCIMTTWHDSEPLEEALRFFLANTWPDDHYWDSTRASLAISIGSEEWAATIRAALDDPRTFIVQGSEDDHS
jgi:hypothetical protein